MIDIFFYSIANKKSNNAINDAIQSLIDLESTPRKEKDILKNVISIASKGHYPSSEWFSEYYESTGKTYKALSEILSYVDKIKDFYNLTKLQGDLISAVNKSDDFGSLKDSVQKLADSADKESTTDAPSVFSFCDYDQRPYSEGIKIGVPDIDNATNGIQPGNVACIAGFTGAGKSTFCNSIVAKNVFQGKKACIVSLEMSPELVWMQFETRWLFEVKGVQVTSDMLLFKKLPNDLKEKVVQYDTEFKDTVGKNLIILDESHIDKSIVLSYKRLCNLFSKIENQLHGLDLVVWDHVGQLELLYPTFGNQIIKQIQAFTKTYVNSKGVHPISIIAVQCNREGNKRATKRNGVYDLQAIADLNECLHAQTGTLVKDISSPDRGLFRGTASQVYKLFNKGHKLVVPVVDYKTGLVEESSIVDAFRKPYSGNWVRLTYPKSGSNKVFTESHKVLVNGNKVTLKSLPKEFKVDCVDYITDEFSSQVLIGTLLGDTTMHKYGRLYSGTLMQSEKQLDYLNWKRSVLGDLCGKSYIVETIINGKKHVKHCTYLKSSCLLDSLSWCHTAGYSDYKRITSDSLQSFGVVSLWVWYLDDGWIHWNTDKSFYCSVGCTNFGVRGANLIMNRIRELGFDGSVHVYHTKKGYTKPRVEIQLRVESSNRLVQEMQRFISIPCLSYKIPGMKSSVDFKFTPIKKGLVKSCLPVQQEVVTLTDKWCYNFTVAHNDHNYVMPGGLISSNCERTSSYVMFIYTSDDMKVLQETKISLAKNRLGGVVEPVSVSFNPQVMTVGSTVENVEVDEDIFNNLGIDFDDDF